MVGGPLGLGAVSREVPCVPATVPQDTKTMLGFSFFKTSVFSMQLLAWKFPLAKVDLVFL